MLHTALTQELYRCYVRPSRQYYIHCTLDSTLGFPTMMMPYLERVNATLRRRGSLRNPIPWCSLERTHDIIIKSFSLPWNASTLATSISWYNLAWRDPWYCMYWTCLCIHKYHTDKNLLINSGLQFMLLNKPWSECYIHRSNLQPTKLKRAFYRYRF